MTTVYDNFESFPIIGIVSNLYIDRSLDIIYYWEPYLRIYKKIATDLEDLSEVRYIKLQAGEIINSHRALVINGNFVYHFNPNDITHYNKCIGLSSHSGNPGELIKVIINGALETGLTFLNGALYYAGVNGQLTTDPSSVMIKQSIGVALSNTRFLIDLKIPIKTII